MFVPVFSEKLPASRTPSELKPREEKRERGFVLFDCEVASVGRER